ncbi:hypothetical protein E3N88_41633 [Mikania micrantha]|uniref:Uncharacterized protein n=1 Tax=Mikania micrantha TaxID=192012 RepID=A0A5N6LK21_9ASTR|nr:hypothetical protein E3N88_41633 [Mikania micrantha]
MMKNEIQGQLLLTNGEHEDRQYGRGEVKEEDSVEVKEDVEEAREQQRQGQMLRILFAHFGIEVPEWFRAPDQPQQPGGHGDEPHE